MDAMTFLLWTRGPGLQIALALFLLGFVLRLFELFSLGRPPDLAVPRPGYRRGGWRTLAARSLPAGTFARQAYVTYGLSYLFHFGLFFSLLFFAPHILLFREIIGISWPALPNAWINAWALLAIAALLLMLVQRLIHPVKRLLSTTHDYFAWALTFAPLLTGYLAFQHALLPYTWMLGIHILSAELLLACLPFTKLIHFATLFVARWYNGDIAGRKGVAS